MAKEQDKTAVGGGTPEEKVNTAIVATSPTVANTSTVTTKPEEKTKEEDVIVKPLIVPGYSRVDRSFRNKNKK